MRWLWGRSRRLGLLLALLGFVWGIALINITLVNQNPTKSSQALQEEILELSARYVKALAEESQDTIDGPYAGRLTGYDLKKTMAVLLENMMDRMGRLEHKVDMVLNRSALPSPTNNSQLILPPTPPSLKPEIPAEVKQKPPDKKDEQHNVVDAKDLLLGAQEDCSLTDEHKKNFPHCTSKMDWMRSHWQSDPCYGQFGVDGSDCSFRVYLSEIETWCPLLTGRKPMNRTQATPPSKNVSLKFELSELLDKLQDPGQRPNYDWMRQRITRMWPNWVTAAKKLNDKQDLSKRTQKRALIHLGLLSKKSGFKIAEGSLKGGPLGELVQWSDIICALYILGHDLTITSEVEQLSAPLRSLVRGSVTTKGTLCPGQMGSGDVVIYTDLVGWKQMKQKLRQKKKQFYVRGEFRTSKWMSACPLSGNNQVAQQIIFTDIIGLKQLRGRNRVIDRSVRIIAQFPTAESQCQNRDQLPIDMIFTDIVGLTQFKRKVRSGYGKFSCLLRIIDSFGTEPNFNLDYFAKSKKLKTQWGMHNLDPRQFYTMFPHSPDNSFMGFVVEQHLNETEVQRVMVRKNSAVVYGKAEYMWQGKDLYLTTLHNQHLEIHGTVFQEPGSNPAALPPFIQNHGILPGPQLHKLLRESKLFIGLGFPYEGPAPLEAIAQGNVFINPKFDPPHNSENTKFFKGKPTRRKLTSQHPYAEEFIGEPHVFTVDINDASEVERVVKRATEAIDQGKVTPYMPYEFQAEGMLQRLSAYLAYQDFCNPQPVLWPPESDVEVILTAPGQDCKEACRSKDLICEPGHFPRINTAAFLEQYGGIKCNSVNRNEDIYFPSYKPDTGQCTTQSQPLLFSCVGDSIEYRRLCPCRTYIQEQTALCPNCL